MSPKRILPALVCNVVAILMLSTSAASYQQPNQTSIGIKYVLVNGAFVIRDGELDTKAFPGQPVRRTISK